MMSLSLAHPTFSALLPAPGLEALDCAFWFSGGPLIEHLHSSFLVLLLDICRTRERRMSLGHGIAVVGEVMDKCSH